MAWVFFHELVDVCWYLVDGRYTNRVCGMGGMGGRDIGRGFVWDGAYGFVVAVPE